MPENYGFLFSDSLHPYFLNTLYIYFLITNNDYKSYFHNSLFRSSIECYDANFKTKDSIYTFLKAKYSIKNLKIDDCVFFNPLENYVFNFTNEKRKESFFLLKNMYKTDSKFMNIVIPTSLRFYIDTGYFKTLPDQIEMVLDSNYYVPEEQYLRPFFFRKFEVSNLEYREFVYWVRDSIARTKLYYCGKNEFGKLLIVKDSNGDKFKKLFLNWNIPIQWNSDENKECLQSMYHLEEERFYRRKEIDAIKLFYKWNSNKDNFSSQGLINIYPDTLCWFELDNRFSVEPLCNIYFWHPAFNDYPVVGISYWQALAFLDWKTKLHQQINNKRDVNVRIEYDLPTENEWEIACSFEIRNKKTYTYTSNYYYFADDSWITDLSLLPKDIKYVKKKSYKDGKEWEYITERNNSLFPNIYNNSMFGNLINSSKIGDLISGSKVCNINKYKKKDKDEALKKCEIDELGICYLGGNVSEWLKESYQKNWNPLFNKRQKLLSTFSDKDIQLISELEKYFDSNNDTNGMLVRGANWLDKRSSNKLGKNVNGNNAKIFVDPNCSYPTLGFRYVIHYYYK